MDEINFQQFISEIKSTDQKIMVNLTTTHMTVTLWEVSPRDIRFRGSPPSIHIGSVNGDRSITLIFMHPITKTVTDEIIRYDVTWENEGFVSFTIDNK